VFVDEAQLDASLNAELVRNGLGYAELYATMPLALIQRMRQLVTQARADAAGFWPTEHLTTTTRIQRYGPRRRLGRPFEPSESG
jgi:hypothetical protein